MLPDARTFGELRSRFRWDLPANYNIAADACDRWAEAAPERTAIIDARIPGRLAPVSYGDLRKASNRLASALRRRGLARGDRLAILLPQGPATAIAHLAAYKLGAIAVPLALLFGIDALAYRLSDAGVRVIITGEAGLRTLRAIQEPLPGLEVVVSADGADGDALGLEALMAAEPDDHFDRAATTPDDPAVLIYTSGTTGPPKGALLAHRVLLGHAPGLQVSHEGLPRPGDLMWTPADWAWAGGLFNMLLPSLRFGVPVVAGPFARFDPDAAFALMAAAKVRNAFIPPTALKMMRAVENPRAHHDLSSLRSIGAAGESLGAETLAWGREALGLTINEFYGQTECNYVIGSCGALGVSRPGFIGKPLPGHEVAVIRPDGSTCAPEELGQIAIRRPDPVMFLGYWNQPEATAAKFIGDWMTTGDEGLCDGDGYIRFVGRDDDVITSAGYRIGPGEIEDCLIRHPAVALAAVVGKPDPLRTEIIKAFIQLKAGQHPTDRLSDEIKAFVRTRLSSHEYPREIAFVDELPLTTTGKVIRRLLRGEA
jgi:acetyl-CoA synthetase